MQVRRVLGLCPEDREVRGSERTVQGTHSLPRPRHAQHLPRLPHLRVHGQPIDIRSREPENSQFISYFTMSK